MTKKDFIALADAIRHYNNNNPAPQFTYGQLLMLARFCKQQNPAFMESRWMNYIAGKCGPNGGKVAA